MLHLGQLRLSFCLIVHQCPYQLGSPSRLLMRVTQDNITLAHVPVPLKVMVTNINMTLTLFRFFISCCSLLPHDMLLCSTTSHTSFTRAIIGLTCRLQLARSEFLVIVTNPVLLYQRKKFWASTEERLHKRSTVFIKALFSDGIQLFVANAAKTNGLKKRETRNSYQGEFSDSQGLKTQQMLFRVSNTNKTWYA